MASPGGSWLQSEAEQTDEGRGAVAFWNNCKAISKCSPTLIRLASRATFPEGKAWVRAILPGLQKSLGSPKGGGKGVCCSEMCAKHFADFSYFFVQMGKRKLGDFY